jgi:hypothetical protein
MNILFTTHELILMQMALEKVKLSQKTLGKDAESLNEKLKSIIAKSRINYILECQFKLRTEWRERK